MIPIPFTDSYSLFFTLLWSMLFFGGALLPAITGIMLNTVDETLRGSANALSQFSQNAFGVMPAPIFYGFISNLCKDYDLKRIKSSHVPMAIMVGMLIFPSIMITYLINRKLKTFKKKDEKPETIKNINNDID